MALTDMLQGGADDGVDGGNRVGQDHAPLHAGPPQRARAPYVDVSCTCSSVSCRVMSCGVQVQPVQVGDVVAMPLTLRCRLWGFRHIRVDPLRI
jgi:hypothetical protein